MSQGYAWTEERFPEGTAFHHGGDASRYGLNAEFRHYPERDLTIGFLANTRHKGFSTRRSIIPAMMRIVSGVNSPSPPAVGPATTASLKPFAGIYSLKEDGQFSVRIEGGHLVVGARGQNAVDILTFQRGAQSRANRRVRNQRAQEFIEAIRRTDIDALETFVGTADAGRELVSGMQREEERFGRLQGADILGTARLDRGVFRTTVRLNFANQPKIARLGWSGNRTGVDSDDAALPTIGHGLAYSPIDNVVEEPVWRLAFRRFAIYDLMEDQTVEVTFATTSSGEIEAMIFHLPAGPVAAHRRRGNLAPKE